jgi:phospholipid/cholesterol/gamma-HCH transport system ATP-binding protein
VGRDDAFLRFVDVHKSFRGQAVLRGVDFQLARGRTLGIMGGSGTGKSVTLRHVIGLLTADTGLVEVDGHDMSRVSPDELADLRRRMGYVFQEGALINWLTVAENLALPLRENSDLSEAEIAARVQEKLEWVHIPDAGAKFPSEISGGMKKRVGLARALITDPEIILYDEPNAGLDPEISASINRLIREVGERLQVTALAVEHRVGCLKTIADEVLFLHEGRVLVHEPTEKFFQPTHPRLIQFLAEELPARAVQHEGGKRRP